MARRKRSSSWNADGVSRETQYTRLEQRLVLLAWLNGLFGYRHNRDILTDVKEAAEGFDASGRSYVCHRLEARGDKVKIPQADLTRYDDNIRRHLQAMNARRSDPIVLRYFQYIAALYAEIFLDWYFHRRNEMLRSLNRFIENLGTWRTTGDPKDAGFSEQDLNKLAFWMATGSGKTLVMHVNYRQFLHYNDRPLDNILLITPNDGLSEQHMMEMAASDIPSRRFDLNESDLVAVGKDTVRIIEITKLVEEKRGGGVSVPVEVFEGNNLIFVDEGHKGSGGEAWRKFREALGETGFTFEYSATFGQALTAARNDQLTAEYGKAIAFDYSYRYFHGEGYGKDFHILNIKEETTEDRTEILLLGNLLSFYEQHLIFEEQADTLRPYNLERPLWVFVGSTVNAVYAENGRRRSDVLTVIRFLHHVLENDDGWAIGSIEKLLQARTGVVTPDGRDAFEARFRYLREADPSPEQVYREVLAKVLRAPAGGVLHLCDLRGSADEIGLKASGAEDYFGLIHIGDTGKFMRLAEQDDTGIILEQDAVTGSLFKDISSPETTIDVLIGAKKFMEGWNSWRVSNMGLLNVGRKEGSAIIQLFGRGIRLRGKGFSLKRSAALDGRHPEHVRLLETLNVFAIRANYMSQFREYLEKEGVETEADVELPLEIEPNEDFLRKGLVVPRMPEDRNFVEEADILLEPDERIRVRVDMSLKVQTLESGDDGVASAAAHTGRDVSIPDAGLDLVDWQGVYLELLEYKEQKGYANLVIRPETPRMIVATDEPSRLYDLVADESIVAPRSFADITLLHEATVSVLRKYMDRFYRVRQARWDSEHMVYTEIGKEDANFQNYTVRIARGEAELITAIRKLIEEAGSIYREDTRELPSIHFDRHLYQPLLIERGDKVRSRPPGLNDGERRFVEDMRAYCRSEKDGSLADKEVFLLRNSSRGKGIGFFDKRDFYPDFILWVKDGSMQRIAFIEPHGMLQAEAYMHDDKARLHESLPALARAMGERSGLKNVALDSFIVSATPYEDLRARYDDGSWNRRRFAEAHILFPDRGEEYDYLAHMMTSLGATGCKRLGKPATAA